jgi:hypothetical protein
MKFIDMQDSSDISVIAETLFTRLNAGLELVPVMDADDLRRA